MNVDSEQLNNLFEPIVKQLISDELELYEIQGKDQISNVLKNGHAKETFLRNEVNFLGEAKAVLEFFKLIDGTIKLLKKFGKVNDNANKSTAKVVLTVQDEWRLILINNGMEAHLAANIASKFSHQLIEIIE